MISIANLNQPVSEIAGSLSNTINFKVGDAECLEEKDSSFDAVTMNFGLLHLSQPQKAISEASRVLKPEQNPGFKLLLKSI